MRFLQASFFLLLVLLPLHGGAESVPAKWLIRTEENLSEWSYGNLEEGTLGPDGLTFKVTEQATIFRPLPPDFHENVDALKIYIGPSTLDEVALLLLRMDDTGKIIRRFRLVLFPDAATLTEGEYIPLTFYRPNIAGTEVLAMSFKGNAETVTFGGVRFLSYSPWEKLRGMVRSFFLTEGIRPYSVNIVLGPVLVPDLGPVELLRESLVLSTSVNAYLLVAIILAGIALLLRAIFRARHRGETWEILHKDTLRRLLLVLLTVWLLYDLRMGTEFLGAVIGDYRSYVLAPRGARTFRERGSFYEFSDFAARQVADRERYEVLLPSDWPYFGNLRYFTLPALPNAGTPVSDTWVIYERPDVTVGDDGRLTIAGVPVTRPGTMLGIFSPHSFVFREQGEGERSGKNLPSALP